MVSNYFITPDSENKTIIDINFTDKAITKFIDIKTIENKKEFDLRLKVISGGCSGFKYDFSFDNQKNLDDYIVEKNNLTILIDKGSLPFLNGVRIDYVESLNEIGFKITNPNAHHTCGCGNSFG
ncbi:MAG TPA: iron-sulfur cluster assembly accessory protein [Candidatus Nanoarchaeia archaeon]|nr:iron-sulfur cluster assembly accessory protein [Candidatus Nanoarchaeia archaeon]